MTNEERNNAIRCMKKWSEENPYLQTYKTCLEALEQCQATDVAEPLSCDRNICISNEYSGIGCDECICSTKDGYCQREDLEEIVPIENTVCKNIDIDRITQEYFGDRESEFEMNEVFALAKQSCWISVKDRLPKEQTSPITRDFYEYPITFQDSDVRDVRYYKFGNGHWWHGPEVMDEYVTAWMPIPKPYMG